jgi:hypothetical protein
MLHFPRTVWFEILLLLLLLFSDTSRMTTDVRPQSRVCLHVKYQLLLTDFEQTWNVLVDYETDTH